MRRLSRIHRVLFGLFLSLGSFIAALGVPAGSALAAGCVTAAPTTMTAVVVAVSGQHISGTIDATGCDIGVYVGPGVTGVTIAGATISGATRHGILVQNTHGVTIQHNIVTGTNPNHETTGERKAIQLEGTGHVTVAQNTVTGNHGGGIAVLDDGPDTPDGLAGAVFPGVGNVVVQNTVTHNDGACGIVVASYEPGGGVAANMVVGNTVQFNPAGIIVAADAPGTQATDNTVVNNTSTDNFLPGVIVHSNAPGDLVTGSRVVNNVIARNGGGAGGVGIEVATGAPGSALTQTWVIANRICQQPIPISVSGATGTRQVANKVC